MKTLSFQTGANYYHLLKEHDIVIDKQVKNGFATITGYAKEQIEVGDILNISGKDFEITELIERRDHAGIFNNPNDKKDGFFKVETKFSSLVSVK